MPDILPVTITSNSPSKTQKLGRNIGAAAKPGDVVLLNGSLGAGKTCLTQGIASGLGVKQPAQSPTFVLVREMAGRIPLYHIDLYRLDNTQEIADLGLDDYFYGPGLTVIEWANKATWLLPSDNLTINIEITDETERVFQLVPSNQYYSTMVQVLKRLIC